MGNGGGRRGPPISRTTSDWFPSPSFRNSSSFLLLSLSSLRWQVLFKTHAAMRW